MKKMRYAGLAALLLTAVVALAWAQTGAKNPPPTPQPGQMHPGMMMQGMMSCPEHMVTVASLAQRQLATTPDGNILVLAGNQLFKYDKDLNLLKKADLPIDQSQIQKTLDQIKANCPKSNP